MSSFLEDIEFASKVNEAIKEAEKRGMDNSIELTKEIIKQQYGDVEELKQENKQLKRDKNIMQNYLQLIKDIGYDYDGYNDVINLKELIDELCKYALCGIKLDDKKIISSSCEKYYNILGEEIFGDKENE